MPSFKHFSSFAVAVLSALKYAKAQEMAFMTERVEDKDTAMDLWLGADLNGVLKCQTCGTVVRRLASKLLEDTIVNGIIDFSIQVCKQPFVNVTTPDIICPSIVPMMAAPIIDVLQREILT